MKFNKIKKFLASALALAMVLTSVPVTGMSTVKAAAGALTSVKSVTTDGNVATVTFNDGIQAKITLLEDGIFRYNVDPSGEFDQYADVYDGYPDTAKIQQYPDSSDNYSKPDAVVTEEGDTYVISSGETKIIFDKNTAKMTVKAGDKTVMQEKAPLVLGGTTVQTLEEQAGEQFFGGGTQNGRFVHTGKKIHISNESGWVDGQVSSPSPFYYSTAGYGVLRNTYMDGWYDFGAAKEGTVTASHNEEEFDAYFFVSDAGNNAAVAQELLQEYFHVTGNPVLLPAYAFYLGHLNAYNRDAWSNESGKKAWTIKGNGAHTSEGTTTYEDGATGYMVKENDQAETLNGYGPEIFKDNVPKGITYLPEFSARAVLDEYVNYDMPFGFFLPNDGYGAGYGQNGYNMQGGVNEDGTSSEDRLAAVEANVKNLKEFADYAKSKGVATGLWTQSNLTPDSNPNTYWHLLRDFAAEVKAGVTTLKTDVAWVGYGYSFQLSGVKQAYDIVTDIAKTRPNIISLDGWAGSQRYNSVWSGDQVGGRWEYIRFHIPTFIGQSLAGNPNFGCDMDGIWGGAPVIATRDYQWKSFAPQMLDMDGWGTYAKGPYVHGDPFTGVSRMYLKTKAMLMPYIYTNAYAAANIDTKNGDKGLPMGRAMFLEFPGEAAAYSELAKYQYMWGENLLVAPVYEDNGADELGNDVRNGIYLPGGSEQIWIDYFTGEQYRGGQILNNFEAPLWKLPLFVKNGAIIPMFAEHNSADPSADKGVDKTQRIVEFWPEGNTEFNTIEDDGMSIENTTDSSDKEYGVIDNVKYGSHVETLYESKVDGTTATLTANKSTGSYNGYNPAKDTTFVVHASKEPTALTASNGADALTEVKAETKEEFDAAEVEAGTFVSFYDAEPEIETFASEEETIIADMVKEVRVSGKLYVKFANADSQAVEQKLVIEGFVNDGELPADKLNDALEAPVLRQDDEKTTSTSIALAWDEVNDAEGYEIEADGSEVLYSVAEGDTVFTHIGLNFDEEHTYRIRSLNKDGHSAWSEEFKAKTKDDPFAYTPYPVSIDWPGGIYSTNTADKAFDREFQQGDAGFHSDNTALENALTVDYGSAYLFDKIEYTHRSGGGNGTVKRMKVSTSLDGVHWVDQPEYNFLNEEGKTTDDMKVMDLSDKTTGAEYIGARFIRFQVLESVGNFFHASEIKPCTVTGTVPGSAAKPFKVGNLSTMGMDAASATTFQQIYQKESSAHGSDKNPNWVGEIQKVYADINFNGISDIYDYAFTAFDADGGTEQSGRVRGMVTLEPSATVLKAGETFTIDVTAEDVRNMNAYGAIMNYDPAKLQYVAAEYLDVDNMFTQNMTGNVVYEDGTAYVNHNAINMGNQPLVEGSKVLSRVTMKALEDVTLTEDVMDLTTVTIMGPGFDYIECKKGMEVNPVIYFGENDFDLTLTNDVLKEDDGNNVHKLIQQESYAALFNGITEAERLFELKWETTEETVLPMTMHMALKDEACIDTVKVYNDTMNKNNGYMTSVTANVIYTDGTNEEYTIENEDLVVFEFKFAGKKPAEEIEITFNKATGTQMLTVNEVEIVGHVPGAIEEPEEPTTDKTLLNAGIKAVQENLKKEDYTAETWSVVSEKLAAAQAVAADGQAAQEAINSAEKALRDAVAALEMAEVETADKLGQDKFDITMTNDLLKDDPTDGTPNVEKLIHLGNYDGLFDEAYGRDFEFKYNIDYEDEVLPEYVTLPVTMHLNLKENAPVNKVSVYNADKGNGYLTSAKAQLVYADGSVSDEVLFNSEQAVYDFCFEGESKDVERIDITFLSAINAAGNPVSNMLTLSQIEVKNVTKTITPVNKAQLEYAIAGANALAEAKDTYTEESWSAVADAMAAAKAVKENPDATQEEISAAAEALNAAIDALEAKPSYTLTLTGGNAALQVGEKTTLTAEVATGEADALEGEWSSSDKNVATVAPVEAKARVAGVSAEVTAVGEGNATITFTSTDGISAEFELAVSKATEEPEKPDVNKDALEEAIAAADALNLKKEDYTADSWAVYKKAYDAAKAKLAYVQATQEEVDAAAKALNDAVEALVKNTVGEGNGGQPGGGQPNPGQPNDGQQGGGQTNGQGGNTAQSGVGAKTGDPAQTTTFVVLLLLAAAAVFVLRKKSKATK